MRRKPSLVGPIILIAIGVLFLLNNFGLLPWGVWELVWRFWPLILVLVGLEILIGWSRSGIVAIIALILGLLLILGSVLAVVYWDRPGVAIETQRLIQDMAGMEGADIEIEFTWGNLIIDSLMDSPNLMEGQFQYRREGLGVSKTFEVLDGKGRLRLESRRGAFFWPFGGHGDRWDIGLTPQIPLALKVDTDIGGASLNLTGLRLTSFDLDAGIGDVTISLPTSAAMTSARVDVGIGRATLEIPLHVAARIKADVGIGSLDIDKGRFPRSGDYYVSADFATAENRLELEVDVGIGGVTIK